MAQKMKEELARYLPNQFASYSSCESRVESGRNKDRRRVAARDIGKTSLNNSWKA